MSALEDLMFELFIRVFDDALLGILIFLVIFAIAMIKMRLPVSATLPIGFLLVSGIAIQMPDDQVLQPLKGLMLIIGGVLLGLSILFLAKRR